MINIVLLEPEIPQNTGNIMRTCIGMGLRLHLIKPLGFILDDKYLKRSCVDYYELIEYTIYESIEDFYAKTEGEYFYLSRYGRKNPSSVDYTKFDNIYFIFGKESQGIPHDILAKNDKNLLRIPTSSKIRSLNLSNTVAIISYEVMRQLGFPDLSTEEPEIYKGAAFLDRFK